MGMKKLPREYIKELKSFTGKSQSFAIFANTGNTMPARTVPTMMTRITRFLSGSCHKPQSFTPQARLVAQMSVVKNCMAVHTSMINATTPAWPLALTTPAIVSKM